MEKNNIIDVFIDEGSAGVKTIWMQDGKIHCDVFPSRVGQEATTDSSGSYSIEAYKANGDDYTVSSSIDSPMPTDVRSYQVSAHNRVLVHESLRRNGFAGKKVRLTTTLPIGDFFAVKPRNQKLIDEKKDNLLKPVTSLGGHKLAEIVDVLVCPEATPAWKNYLLDDDGKLTNLDVDENHRILIVDSGGTTTDMAIVDGWGNIQKYTSERVGGFAVGENLRPMLMERFDRKAISNQLLDTTFKTGQFAGEDVSKEIEKACRPVENRILTVMEKFQPDADAVSAVLYVGGLSSLTAKRLSDRYGGVSIVGDVFSIVRGIFKQNLVSKKEASADVED